MAYIRKKGSQLVLVHGEREAGTGRVQQRVLFTIYSKAEALAIIGRPDKPTASQFESLLSNQYPALRFDWNVIRAAIRDNLDVLPNLYEYKSERIEKRFRRDLGAFARQLFLADPQQLQSAANLIEANRGELEVLAELIHWRLEQCQQEESEWNRDNPFFWRFSLPGSGVPPEAEEFVTSYYEEGDYRRAEAGFRLLTESFEQYAEGYNYLGLIARQEQRYDAAVGFFEKTIEVGRTLFPKRMARKHYWRDLATRPYMRGLRNLRLTLSEMGRFDEALELCDRLENECNDDVTTSWHRMTISLNLRSWEEALKYASRILELHPDAAFIEAFASNALGDRRAALTAFLHAALNHPRAARMLAGLRVRATPVNNEEIRDHNAGVSLSQELHAYLAKPPRGSKRFFKKVLEDPRVEALLEEVGFATRRWSENRQGSDRSAFDRMTLMRSRPFVETEAHRLLDLVEETRLASTTGGH
jgi:tetratricopeptide (TPR) repeat protein